MPESIKVRPMDILAGGVAELGLDLSDHQLDQFERYYRELTAWNKRVNLTAITVYRDVQVRHFLDSLTVLLAVPDGLPSGTRIIDIGAGAGFPGVPLKLAFPDIHLTSVESAGKKARFLEHLVDNLALTGVGVLTGRAEQLARRVELREGFDLVVSRGVGGLSALLEYSLPYCRQGGRLALLRGRDVEREIGGASGALEVLGGRTAGIHPVRVAGLDDGRVVLSVEKVHATPEKYPRRPGMPAKRPL